jgi:hypothetical protein
MKITSIEVHPENSSSPLILSLRDPKNLNPFMVKSITGLDADELSQRLIVIKVGLNPSYKANASLRDSLYRSIYSSRSGMVQIQLLNGSTVVAATSGFITKLEAPHFEKVQEVTFSVQCETALFKSLSPVSVPTSGINLTSLPIIDDESTAPHGFTFDMTVIAAIPSLSITTPADPDAKFEIAPSGGFQINDTLLFSSEPNDKYVQVKRVAQIIPIADSILPGYVWPMMYPGTNIFSFSNASKLRLNEFLYYKTFWGV